MKKQIIIVLILFSALIIFADENIPRKTGVLIEAENFLNQLGGNVEKVNGFVDCSGSLIKDWDLKNHLLEWEFKVPETGEYKIALRYTNTGGDPVYKELLIDNKDPGFAFKKIRLQQTEGNSEKKNNWRNFTVRSSNGKAAIVKLEKGKHMIRLVNLNENKVKESFYMDNIGVLPVSMLAEELMGNIKNIVIEAEDLMSEYGGQVAIQTDRKEVSGSSIANWDFYGHTIEWKFYVSEEGDYKIVLRYASDNLNNFRKLYIDNQLPDVFFENLLLKTTRGWSQYRNDWQNFTIKKPDGSVFLIRLKKGVHTLKMVNTGEKNTGSSINLDNIGILSSDSDPQLHLGKTF